MMSDKIDRVVQALLEEYRFLFPNRLFRILAKKEIREKLGVKKLRRDRVFKNVKVKKNIIEGRGLKYPYDSWVEESVKKLLSS